MSSLRFMYDDAYKQSGFMAILKKVEQKVVKVNSGTIQWLRISFAIKRANLKWICDKDSSFIVNSPLSSMI